LAGPARLLTGRPVLSIPALAGEAGLAHGFSTLALGSMRGDADGALETPARQTFARALGLDGLPLTVAGAVHGDRVARVDRPLGVVEGADGLVTDRPGVPLLATFADCYPVLLLDARRRCLALAHAGWRGTAAGIAARAVEALSREYGSRPEDLVAGIGPGICGSCYEVGEEVAQRFSGDVFRPGRSGRFLLDLAEANRQALVAAGMRPDRVHLHGACTLETPELPSHRRSPDGARFACLACLLPA
jgi:polyphenol oxidase